MIKRPALFGVALALSFTTAHAADLAVEVTGLRNNQGTLAVCVTADKTGFPDCAKSRAATQRVVPAGAATRPITFKNLAPGTYAVAIIHDENSNGRLDTNFLGIPKEGIAVSNNAVPKFSAPTFKAAGFVVGKDVKQTVRMVYW